MDYEEYQEFYEEPDYEQFERKMLDLDRDAGEFDLDYEEDSRCHLCSEIDESDGEDWNFQTGCHLSCEKQEGIDFDAVDYV